ncbi:MAG TPA: GNAT family N-acetyltransferase [Burkholderiales bacterium]|nr:GNAT family N-acetyltransferase [Burkholderiales bacterium]
MADALLLPQRSRRYPAESVEIRLLADGRPLLIRPIAARDADLVQDFVRRLSTTSRYQRFQGALRELAPDLLARLLAVDYQRSMAFVAVVFEHGHRRIIGEARYAPALDDADATDFALAIADAWQRRGIGRLLFTKLLQHAERNGVTRIQGDVLHDNTAMLALARQFGFALGTHPDGAWLTRVEKTLGSRAIPA